MKRKETINQILENFFCIKRKMMANGHGFSGKNGMTQTQAQVLHIIKMKDGIGVKELAETLGTSSSAITQLVDGLVTEGFLIRESCQEDRRALKLRLSDESKNRINKFREHGLEKMADLFANLSDEELEQFNTLAQKIVENITRERNKTHD